MNGASGSEPAAVSGKLLLQTIAGAPRSRTPFWLMRQAGRYLPEYQRLRAEQPDFLAFCYTPELTVEAALQPLRRFAPDAAIVFSDILVIPDALGRSVRFIEGEGPVLQPLTQPADIVSLDVRALDQRLEPVYQSVQRLRAALPDGVALIGFAGAPWTIAHYLVEGRSGSDGSRLKLLAYREERAMRGLLDILVAATLHHLIRQVKSGAEVVQLFDSWAGGLPEDVFRAFVIEPTAALVSAFREACPGVPVIGFPRGAGAMLAGYAEATGVDVVSIDAAVPLDWCCGALPPDIGVQGNLDNMRLVAGGAELEMTTERILHGLSSRRHVFNLGHGVLPETPPEHVARVADCVRHWCRP
jgi:uroporphyrinogen decarboxylase